MEIFQVTLIAATFLCTLVAGLVFAFAVVVMPGIRGLGDAEFLRAFQRMDRVIQNNQPVFMLVWAGSVIALVVAAVLGFGQLVGQERVLLTTAAFVYPVGVQLPTAVINIPLNNKVQTLSIGEMDDGALAAAREESEARWNRANVARTVFASLASALLIVLLSR